MPDETKEQEKVSTTEQWHNTPTPKAFCPDIVLGELWWGAALGIKNYYQRLRIVEG